VLQVLLGPGPIIPGECVVCQQHSNFIRQVREQVTPGTSALFALTSGANAPERVIDELKAYDFEIISTNLPEEQENKLREAFAHEEE
jgi:uncharacterized membrane protein